MPTRQREYIEMQKHIYLNTAGDLVNGDKTVPQQTGELGEVADLTCLIVLPTFSRLDAVAFNKVMHHAGNLIH